MQTENPGRNEPGTQRHVPVGVAYCPGLAGVKGNDGADKTGGKSNHHRRLASRKTSSVEELETLHAATKTRTPSHHRSPGGGERRRKGKRSTIFLERMRKGHRLATSPTLELCFKGNIRETSERRGGAHMGFLERIDTILN